MQAELPHSTKQADSLTITSFGAAPFELLKPIQVHIRDNGEEDFIASFLDANVNASGNNPAEALSNLTEVILTRFDTLDKLPPEKLGKAMQRQIAVLRDSIRRRG